MARLAPNSNFMLGEIETAADELGASPMPVGPATTAGTTRYKLPQSSGLVHHSTKRAPRDLSEASDDFNMTDMLGQEGTSGNVSFLMKHRIRQTAGESASKVRPILI